MPDTIRSSHSGRSASDFSTFPLTLFTFLPWGSDTQYSSNGTCMENGYNPRRTKQVSIACVCPISPDVAMLLTPMPVSNGTY